VEILVGLVKQCYDVPAPSSRRTLRKIIMIKEDSRDVAPQHLQTSTVSIKNKVLKKSKRTSKRKQLSTVNDLVSSSATCA